VKGYWEEPIMIVYKRTFNYAANYLEIETWLNENFDPSGFSPEQILRCDFLCKNYNDEMLQGYRLIDFDPYTTESLAVQYSTTSNNVYNFLGLENQLNAIISLMNFFLKKNNKTSLIVDSIKDLSGYANYISYNKINNTFYSSELNTFREADLRALHAYIYQYQLVYKTYLKYLDIASIPKEVLKKFDLKDISITNGGNFFYKIINGRWTYYPYTHIEFCNNTICSDCYDSLDLKELYANKRYCFVGAKYTLTECVSAVPYGEILSFSMPILVDIPEEGEYDMLSNLLS
jgi:phage pi2 protein 07